MFREFFLLFRHCAFFVNDKEYVKNGMMTTN